MSIRLDPRRLGHLKQLAGDAGVRPGDLVRQWVEERIDVERGGAPAAQGPELRERVDELTARVAALEVSAGLAAAASTSGAEAAAEPRAKDEAAPAEDASAADHVESEGRPSAPETETPEPRKRQRRASAAPTERVALHDEIIAVIREHGPQTSAELADAIAARGRYMPPRSGKPLDAAMISQRVSNPTYRGRFVRNEGRIGLADE